MPHKFILHFTSSANIELKLHRYGNQVAADELNSLYDHSRTKGFGSEVKMRILMGTYALLAGYYDAYYKRAQQIPVSRDGHNNLLFFTGEKKNDPLAMYAGNIMTVVYLGLHCLANNSSPAKSVCCQILK
ncbi:hypothetical protein RHGRI_015029 [Rhododendron griersonianum]|uniref:Uncharacterized protein n=1 Tax=Rhododendron griersonianum TaxID=479676 RepID=A0AAV6KCA0_9ERIC|nr:hypothetical protein RHGRI_015029 [Rhododendron griersonianum]